MEALPRVSTAKTWSASDTSAHGLLSDVSSAIAKENGSGDHFCPSARASRPR